MRRLPLYVFLAVLGIGLFPLSLGSLYFGSSIIGKPLQGLGNWNYWILFLSFIAALYGGYYTFSYIRRRREFFGILESGSKAKIAKNVKKLREDAQWLGKRYVEVLEEKLKELKIR